MTGQTPNIFHSMECGSKSIFTRFLFYLGLDCFATGASYGLLSKKTGPGNENVKSNAPKLIFYIGLISPLISVIWILSVLAVIRCHTPLRRHLCRFTGTLSVCQVLLWWWIVSAWYGLIMNIVLFGWSCNIFGGKVYLEEVSGLLSSIPRLLLFKLGFVGCCLSLSRGKIYWELWKYMDPEYVSSLPEHKREQIGLNPVVISL
ncbi:hypothetical protein QBC38DRAFT_489307, partial [Podospora fimiseda]